jgi:hypothetical protein
MVPVKPLYQGNIISYGSLFIRRFKFATISLGLKQGINVLQPVPIPSAPFTKESGIIGR